MKSIAALVFSLALCAPSALLAEENRSPFTTVPPPAADSLRFDHELPAFEARDLDGRLWNPASLKGKWTVIEIWGTFCPPCRREHPELQRFSEKWKKSDNLQILTFSLDEDPRITGWYRKDRGYTFPAIVSQTLTGRLFPSDGALPATWVVDPQGRRSAPFKSWRLGRILSEVERIAQADPAQK